MQTIYERIKYLIGEGQRVGIERVIKDSFDRGKINDGQRVELKILLQDLESKLSMFDMMG